MRSLLAALLFTVSAFAATFPVSTPTLDEPPETRSVPELTAGTAGYLATWTDARSGATVLLAARVAADGSVLDPTGIVIAPVPSPADVIWNGERYLVFFPYGPDLAVRSALVVTSQVPSGATAHDSTAVMRRRMSLTLCLRLSSWYTTA